MSFEFGYIKKEVKVPKAKPVKKEEPEVISDEEYLLRLFSTPIKKPRTFEELKSVIDEVLGI